MRRSSWTEVRDHIAAGGRFAVLPFGALEAHGPHLPLATDTIVARRAARELAEHFDALLLPAIEYGDTWGTAGYPGTISLSPETVSAIALDIARALAGFGVTHLVIVNGDFGNRVPLGSASRVAAGEGLRVLVLDYPGLPEEIARVRESEPAIAGMNHAEEIETSMVLAAEPDTVQPEHYAADYPTYPVDWGLRPIQVHTFSDTAVFGDPSTATAAKGEALYAAVLSASVPLVESFLSA